MLYATDLLLVPESSRGKGTKGFIMKLAKMQRQACLHITSTMKSSPTEAIDACTDILPFTLLVENIVFWSTLRLATLPKSPP